MSVVNVCVCVGGGMWNWDRCLPVTVWITVLLVIYFNDQG